jgi:dUTP pyrophosphatase
MIFKPANPSINKPKYQSEGAAGFDFHADIPEQVILMGGETRVFGTGVYVAVPVGFELQVRSRSGLAAKNAVHVLNGPGTIDSDYRGEIGVILHNTKTEAFIVQPNDRIAQGVVAPVIQPEFLFVDELPITERGAGSFGSTGR